MKAKLFTLIVGFLLSMPIILRAEEVEIQLMEVIQMGSLLPGDDPLDGPGETQIDPTRPTSFHATINGTALSINRLNNNIPSAQATVMNAQTGSIVLNQQFSSSLQSQIVNSGMYILHIQTATGALVGQFVVQ